jgi:hypothetical protein
LPGIGIGNARDRDSAAEKLAGAHFSQLAMIAQEAFVNLNLFVREILGRDTALVVVLAGFLQIGTLKRASDRDFALDPATAAADMGSLGRAKALRFAFLTERADHFVPL